MFIYFICLQDLRLVAELTHKHRHTDDKHDDNSGLLDKTNTATELGGHAVTSWGTLGTSDATAMVPPLSMHLDILGVG